MEERFRDLEEEFADFLPFSVIRRLSNSVKI